jgi:hypothetical protein
MAGGNDSANDAMNEQIQQQKAEMAKKLQAAYDASMDIFKSQGGQQWHANKPDAEKPTPPREGWFF